MLEGDVLQTLSELLSQKPQYEWSSVNWHEGTPLPPNVINQVRRGDCGPTGGNGLYCK